MWRIKNWSSFQSYKDRRPPWIRFHKSILDDYEFHSMSANARAILPMLWLLASEDDDPVSGLLRNGYEKIAFRLRAPRKDIEAAIKECIKNGFIEEISESGQLVTESLQISNETVPSETETETETEKSRDRVEKVAPAPFDPITVKGLDQEAWRLWIEHRAAIKKPIKPHSLADAAEALAKLGSQQLDEVKRSRANGWQGLFPDKKNVSKAVQQWM